jgi:hypothetical protein
MGVQTPVQNRKKGQTMNALIVLLLLCSVFVVIGVIADNWPSRQTVETWLDARFDRVIDRWADYAEDVRDGLVDKCDPDAIRSDRAVDRYWALDRLLRRLGIAHPDPSTCESCGRIWSASDMTLHADQYEVCPPCQAHFQTRLSR